VDQPPVIAVVAWLVRHVLGDSLYALRLVPAISGAARIVVAAVLAREFGARRFGMMLAAIATFSAIIYWPLDHLFTMNTFEPLIWMGCAYVVARVIKTGNQKLWLWFGVLAGVGMETKYSMAIFSFAVVVGLLLTPERKAFAHRWIWIAGAIALAIFLPNLIWNFQHHWPFLELMRNINASGRDIKLGPVSFIATQILLMNPLTFPVWLAGAIWLFFSRNGRRFRALGWAFVVTFPVHVTVAVSALFAGKALGLPIKSPYYFVAVPVIVLVGSIPISPQGIGVMEYFAVKLTEKQGATVSQAFALTMYIRLVQVLWNLTGGILVFRGGYHAPTESEQREVEDAPEPTAAPSAQSAP
jgi:4-amino-4-deoxy-L-arabinose transferase-like glycosyltransferase